jgi:hypothetical protein
VNVDPDVNLQEIRKACREVKAIFADDNLDDGGLTAMRLVELVEDLDGWLSRGGFLPQLWRSRE